MRQYNTDCEGPISLNDNAQELAEFFIPDGAEFFAKLSKYDDFLADIEKKPGYRAGMTLRLILPFLKAYGATDEKIWDYSSKHISLVPGAKETLKYINGLMPTFIISTSYKPYIHSICELVNFPKERAFCTDLNLDAFDVSSGELESLKRIGDEIAVMPMIELPDETRRPSWRTARRLAAYGDDATTFEELPETTKTTIVRLNEIFWEEIFSMESGEMYKNETVVGGQEKANVVVRNAESLGSQLSDVMYVGDSITDVQALEIVKDAGGVAVSFNGNRYAVESSEIACIAEETSAVSSLAAMFKRGGREATIELVRNWSLPALKDAQIDEDLIPSVLPTVKLVKDSNKAKLIEESVAIRKAVRGRAGALG